MQPWTRSCNFPQIGFKIGAYGIPTEDLGKSDKCYLFHQKWFEMSFALKVLKGFNTARVIGITFLIDLAMELHSCTLQNTSSLNIHAL